ncbi:MAG: UDP-3-O-(3-hydroxymyristoyl)glucosamine N-acyltransferase [Bacteroidetes bacterium]|nr:MAG: UDP-3-O-(3-hydroxymyristoyl)glucosamine N-acyltransferase [Bacteroidota bacterium]
MEFSVEQIATILSGTVEGDAELMVNTFGKIQTADEGELSFLANDKYEQYLYTSNATAIIVSNDLVLTKPIKPALIRVNDPYASFSTLLEFYEKAQQSQKTGIEEPSFIHENSSLGDECYVGAFAYIGDGCKIGNNVKIYPHAYIGENCTVADNSIIYSGAKLYEGTKVGSGCIIHSGAVLGSDGFGWAPQDDGSYKAIPQMGYVELEDNVSIGANTTIDCATFPNSATQVKEGAKIDNLIMLAHNVVIGKHTVIAAQTGVSGSTEIGDNCILAGQVGVVGHLEIANKTTVGAQSGVSKSIKKEGETVFGYPAYDIKGYLSSYAVFKKLPEIYRRLSKLEKKS